MDARAMPTEPIRCRKCGSNYFVLPANSTNDSLVTCARCDAEIGRWGDLRIGLLEDVREKKSVVRTKAQKATTGR